MNVKFFRRLLLDLYFLVYIKYSPKDRHVPLKLKCSLNARI
jgi:hypothetical protein